MIQGTPVNIIVGSQVWIEDPDDAWIDGEVTEIKGSNATVVTTNGRKVSSHTLINKVRTSQKSDIGSIFQRIYYDCKRCCLNNITVSNQSRNAYYMKIRSLLAFISLLKHSLGQKFPSKWDRSWNKSDDNSLI